MPAERRGWAIRVTAGVVNWQQEEPSGRDGRRQLSRRGTSRVTGDSHALICESLGVKFPGATRPHASMPVPTRHRAVGKSICQFRAGPGPAISISDRCVCEGYQAMAEAIDLALFK